MRAQTQARQQHDVRQHDRSMEVSGPARSATEPLAWGRRYVMVEPTHFRIDYVINPFMDPDIQPDPARAMDQWLHLVDTLRGLGAQVDVLPQRADAPDMVYAMNLGLALQRPGGDQHVVLSHMRHPQRRMETDSAQQWWAERGATTTSIGRDGVGAHLEAGDAFAWRGDLVVGYGPRTEELALKHLASELQLRVHGLRITHPGMYHLDLAFCPVDERRALVCLDALDAASARTVLDLVPEPVLLSEAEALTTFAANSVVVGSTVVMPACPRHIRRQLEDAGFDVVIVDVSEYHLGGGSIRCLSNPVDVRLGRDLEIRPSGEVRLPPV